LGEQIDGVLDRLVLTVAEPPAHEMLVHASGVLHRGGERRT
jgi:hypothetical protein